MSTRFLPAFASLTRLPNLPSVWSNVLTGWLFALAFLSVHSTVFKPTSDSFTWGTAILLCLAATLLYFCGTLLNDAADAGFDRKHRPERPIPSGILSAPTVLNLGLACGLLGLACLFFLGPFTMLTGALLLLAIVLYTWMHKRTAWGVLPMGLCRALLYPLGAMVGIRFLGEEFTLLLIVSSFIGLSLLSYVAGLTLVARFESGSQSASKALLLLGRAMLILPFLSPLFLLAIEFTLTQASTTHTSDLLTPGMLLGFDLNLNSLLWWLCPPMLGLAWLAFALPSNKIPIQTSVQRMLAAIPLVDLVWMPRTNPALLLIPLTAFALALLLQKSAPAT